MITGAAHPGPLGNHQGRHRDPGRPDRRHRRAGNPTSCPGAPGLVVGPSTEIIAGNGRIITAGAIDCHVHLHLPADHGRGALGGGITTIIGGGTGPAEGTKATTVTPAPGTWAA